MVAPFFDTHAHIDGKEYAEDREQVLDRARKAGLTHIVCIGASDGMDANYTTLDVANAHPEVYATVGVHPHHANIVDDACLAEVERMAVDNPKVVAIGETGLDYHYDYSPRDVQRDVFEKFMGLARKLDMPVIIHTREAEAETAQIIAGPAADGLVGVLHSFTGDAALAKVAIDRGWYVSFSGILTFRNADTLRAIAQDLPPDKVMVETDCPYLTPTPHRGTRNEPCHVVHVADRLAELWDRPAEEVRRMTGENAARFYGIEV